MLNKLWGQNFLINVFDIKKLVELVDFDSNILEIGCGHGEISDYLIENIVTNKYPHKFVACEIDIRLYKHATRRYKNILRQNKFNLHFIHDDVLNLNLDEIFDNKSYSIVSNLPFSSAKKIIESIIINMRYVKDMHLIIQKEVAYALQKDNLLGTFIKTFFDFHIVAIIGKESFDPAPSIDSAIVSLHRNDFDHINRYEYLQVLKKIFLFKRKKLSNKNFNFIPDHLLDKRTCELDIKNFLEIYHEYKKL